MSGEVCIANIGPRQRRARFVFGVVMGLAAVAYLSAAVMLGWPKVARLGVFLPAWLSALGFAQHREKT